MRAHAYICNSYIGICVQTLFYGRERVCAVDHSCAYTDFSMHGGYACTRANVDIYVHACKSSYLSIYMHAYMPFENVHTYIYLCVRMHV